MFQHSPIPRHRLTATTSTATLAVVTGPRFAYANNSGVLDGPR
jgi:hypothetical protein